MLASLQRQLRRSPIPPLLLAGGLLVVLFAWGGLQIYQQQQQQYQHGVLQAQRLAQLDERIERRFQSWQELWADGTRAVARSILIQRDGLEMLESLGGVAPLLLYQGPDWWPNLEWYRQVGRIDHVVIVASGTFGAPSEANSSTASVRLLWNLNGTDLALADLLPADFGLSAEQGDAWFGNIGHDGIAGFPAVVGSAAIDSDYSLILIGRLDASQLRAQFDSENELGSIVVTSDAGGAGPQVNIDSSSVGTQSAIPVTPIGSLYSLPGSAEGSRLSWRAALSAAAIDELQRQVQLVTNDGSTPLAIVVAVVFGFLILLLYRRLNRLVSDVAGFSQQTFGVSHFSDPEGDPVSQLEQRFYLMTREIIDSRDTMRVQHEKSLRDGEVNLLQTVTEGLGVGVILHYRHGPRAINPRMQEFQRWFGGLELFLIDEPGQVELELTDRRGQMRTFAIRRLEGVAHVGIYLVQDVTESRIKTSLLEYQATHDELTRLPNRALLISRLHKAIEHAAEADQQLALAILDLDGFKEINDTLGHPAGDEILQQIAGRIPGSLSDEQLFARLGGDEFAILMPGSKRAEAESVVAQVTQALDQPFMLDSQTLMVSGSFGIALYPEQGENADELLQHADVAMYLAKRQRRTSVVYDPELDPHSRERLQLMGELKQAIAVGQLRFHLQPQAEMVDGRIVSAEVLVRWQHPEHGDLEPKLFIPLAEQTGMIRVLTHWLLEQAITQLAEWQSHGIELRISVNLSTHDLIDSALAESIAKLLDQHGVAGEKLALEITESSMMADPDRAQELLQRLSDMGIWLSVDDFGTGFSSMNYLKRLPVNEIKIDQSFVAGMLEQSHDAVIVRSIIDLAHNLGMKVVAEGVENYDTWEVLLALGCDKVQGHYIGRPVPANEMPAPEELPVTDGNRDAMALFIDQSRVPTTKQH